VRKPGTEQDKSLFCIYVKKEKKVGDKMTEKINSSVIRWCIYPMVLAITGFLEIGWPNVFIFIVFDIGCIVMMCRIAVRSLESTEEGKLQCRFMGCLISLMFSGLWSLFNIDKLYGIQNDYTGYYVVVLSLLIALAAVAIFNMKKIRECLVQSSKEDS